MVQYYIEYVCPYCGETITSYPELSEEKQEYIEDCEVCCNPVNIKFTTDGKTIKLFEASQTE